MENKLYEWKVSFSFVVPALAEIEEDALNDAEMVLEAKFGKELAKLFDAEVECVKELTKEDMRG